MAKRILLIDDVALIRQTLREILIPPVSAMAQLTRLIEHGSIPEPEYQIDEADQGELGVEMVKASVATGNRYDMAIVDMKMPPGIDGAETIKRIREIDADLRILICTGHADTDIEHTRDQNGHIPPVIYKPFSAEDLLALMQQFDAETV